MSWLRIDDNTMGHPKVRVLSDHHFRVWLRMLCACSQHDDPSIDEGVMNEVKDFGPATAKRFHDLGLLDETPHGYRVHNWEKYRPKDPTAAERKRRERDKKRDMNRDTDRDENVTSRARVPDPSRTTEGSTLSLTPPAPLPEARPHTPPFAEALAAAGKGRGDAPQEGDDLWT